MAYSILPLENLAELKNRRGNATNTTIATILGLNYPTVEAFAVYVWDNLSTVPADDDEIVQPTVGGVTTGRWFKVDIGINTALVIAALGYTPYDSSNPDGFIDTESDPTVPAYAKTLNNFAVIKASTDALYEIIFTKKTAFNKDFGTALGTITEGNDSRVLNGQTAFGWGNHSGLYPLLLGAYADPSWITSLAYSKLTGAPSIPASQVNTDWNAVSGVSQLLNKPTLFSGAYTDLTGKPAIPTDNNQLSNGSGYITAGSTSTLTNKSGNISQWTNNSGYLTSFTELDPTVPTYSKTLSAFSVIKSSTDPLYKAIGYTPTSLEITTALGFTPYNSTNPNGYISNVPAQSFSSLTGKPTTLSGYGITDAYPLTGNPSAFLTSITSGQVTTALGFTPYSASNPNLYINQAGARTSISLTTIGSGVATYNNSTGILNIPTPAGGTVTSVGITGSDFSISGSPIITSGNIALSLSTTGISAGTYGRLTVDTKGRTTAGKDQIPYTGVTDASGNYTISFGKTYASVPCTMVTLINPNVRDTPLPVVTTTGFTVNVQRRVDVLGLLPSYGNVVGATVHVLITEN